jgi:hypothetical protein
MILITIIATTALAALLLGRSQYMESVHSRRRVDRDWDMVFSVTLFGVPFLAAGLLVIALPVVLLFSGTWSWPLASWPLLVQLGTLLPVLSLLVFGTLRLLEDDVPQPLRGISQWMTRWSLLISIVLVPLLLFFYLSPGWPLWVQIGIGLIWLPAVLLFLIGLLIDSIGRDGSYWWIASETWILLSLGAFVIFALCLLSLWFLALLPIGILVAALASGGGGIGETNDPSFTSHNY